jgi:hypothetical protein
VWKDGLCNVFLAGGGFPYPLCPFNCYLSQSGFFGLMCLGNYIVQLLINLNVFDPSVLEQVGGVRTRKSCWNKKLWKVECVV